MKDEIVRCKDCKHRPVKSKDYKGRSDLEFPDYKCPCQCDDYYYSWYPDDDWFCANGEKDSGMSKDNAPEDAYFDVDAKLLKEQKPKTMELCNGELYCPSCGEKLKSYYHYCNECGQAVK